MENEEPIVFEEIIAPVAQLIEEEAKELGDDAEIYKLSFMPFPLIYCLELLKVLRA